MLTLCAVLLSAGMLPGYLLIAWDLGCCYAEYCLFCPLLVSMIFLAFSGIYPTGRTAPLLCGLILVLISGLGYSLCCLLVMGLLDSGLSDLLVC
jgi:hypothetical protein